VADGQLLLDESNISTISIPSGTTRVAFSNRLKCPIDEGELIRTVGSSIGRFGVDRIEFAWNSQIETMRLARQFPKVQSIGCESQKMKDLRELVGLDHMRALGVTSASAPARSLDVLPLLKLSQLSVDVWKKSDAAFIGKCGGHLDSLWLQRWRDRDFGSLHELESNEIKINGGSAVTSAGLNCGRLRSLEVTRCKKFMKLEGLRVPRLKLESCHRLELATVGDVKGLRNFRFATLGTRGVDSLEFLRRCSSLETLSITARMPDDLSPLEEPSSLRFAWLWLPTDRLVRISRANPTLLLGNAESAVRAGEVLPSQVYSNAVNAYFSELNMVEHRGIC
jgi:hypothetical protein